MTIEYIPLKKAIKLEEIIGWLSNYKGSEDGILHLIGNSNKPEDMDVYYTKQLKRLGELNKERESILNTFKL